MENKINLEEILGKYSSYMDIKGNPKAIVLADECKSAMLDFAKQLLKLAAKNSCFNVRKYGTWHSNNFKFKTYTTNLEAIEIYEQSILDTIKQVE